MMGARTLARESASFAAFWANVNVGAWDCFAEGVAGGTARPRDVLEGVEETVEEGLALRLRWAEEVGGGVAGGAAGATAVGAAIGGAAEEAGAGAEGEGAALDVAAGAGVAGGERADGVI